MKHDVDELAIKISQSHKTAIFYVTTCDKKISQAICHEMMVDGGGSSITPCDIFLSHS